MNLGDVIQPLTRPLAATLMLTLLPPLRLAPFPCLLFSQPLPFITAIP